MLSKLRRRYLDIQIRGKDVAHMVPDGKGKVRSKKADQRVTYYINRGRMTALQYAAQDRENRS